jgi:hypothetical protein
MSTGDYDILGRVREEAGNLPTPPPQYEGPRPRRQGPQPIPVGSRSANAVHLPPGAEAAAEDRPPLAPLQEINERTRIINPLKRRREVSDMEGGKRRSTTREERLQALDFEDNAREWQNKKGEMELKRPSRRRVAALLGVDEAQLRRWRQEEKKILDSSSKSRRIGSGRKAEWPEMEVRLAEEWKARWGQGLEITRNWFERRAKAIFEEEYLEEVKENEGKKDYGCGFSDGWFAGFKNRHLISWRVPTSQAQQMPEDYRNVALQFLRFLRRNSVPHSSNEAVFEVGRFRRRLIFNFDQMSLPFDFSSSHTYAPQGATTVKKKTESPKAWLRRQATLALLICADGQNRCKPLIIFRGEGKTAAISKEMKYYDQRVEVQWQARAWTDTPVMLRWIERQYSIAGEAEDREANLPRLFTLYTCPTHRTIAVLKRLSSPDLNTTVALIPEGLTGELQPLDTHINRSMRQYIHEFLQQRLDDNWQSGFPGKANVKIRERRILMTHCVADAWDKLHREHSSLVQRSFQQDGIALDPEGSEDHLLSVKDLPNLAPEIGDRSVWEEGGLNCNLEPPVMINGRKGKSHTGNGLLKDDDWPHLLQLLDTKDALAREQEVTEHEEDDQFAAENS